MLQKMVGNTSDPVSAGASQGSSSLEDPRFHKAALLIFCILFKVTERNINFQVQIKYFFNSQKVIFLSLWISPLKDFPRRWNVRGAMLRESIVGALRPGMPSHTAISQIHTPPNLRHFLTMFYVLLCFVFVFSCKISLANLCNDINVLMRHKGKPS